MAGKHFPKRRFDPFHSILNERLGPLLLNQLGVESTGSFVRDYKKRSIEQSKLGEHSQRMNRIRVRAGPLTFLRTELETGLTFATIAEQASEEGKINRNRDNARKAYQSARHFMGRLSLSNSESAELHEKLEALEKRLRLLEDGA